MVEAAPAPSLVMCKTEFLFQLLVIALDAPAHLGQIDQSVERGILRDGGQAVFGGCGVALWPFDQQPFLATRLGPPIIAMRRPHPNPGKARRQRSRRSFAPGNHLPACLGQVERERLDADRTVLCIAARELGWAAAPDLGRGGSGAVPGAHTEVCGCEACIT